MNLDTSENRDRDALISELQSFGAKFRGNACKCLWHDDKSASAGVYEKDGVWRYHCNTPGCGVSGDIFDIRAKAKDVPLRDVLPADGNGHESKRKPPPAPPPPPKRYPTLQDIQAAAGSVEAIYHYSDSFVIFRVKIAGKKAFKQARRDGDAWIWGAPPKPWPLYNRESIGLTEEPVIVVEGEKCVEALRAMGVVAVSSPCGAGKGKCADWEPLRDRDVILWPDNDEPGIKHIGEVAEILKGVASKVRTLDIARLVLGPKEDVADYLLAHPDADIIALVEENTKPKRLLVRANIIEAGPIPPTLWSGGPVRREAGMIASESGKGKSLYMLGQVLSVATGISFFPSFEVTEANPVIYLSYEDKPHVLHDRIEAFCGDSDEKKERVKSVLDSGQLAFYCDIPEALFVCSMSHKLESTALFLELQIMALDTKPGLIVVDPLSEAVEISEEKDGSLFGRAIARLADLAFKTNSVVMIVHHANKAGANTPTQASFRGHSSMMNRSRWLAFLAEPQVAPIGGENQVELTIVKDSYHPKHQPVQFLIDAQSPRMTEIASKITDPSQIANWIREWLESHSDAQITEGAILQHKADGLLLYTALATEFTWIKAKDIRIAINTGIKNGIIIKEARRGNNRALKEFLVPGTGIHYTNEPFEEDEETPF